LTLAWQSLPIRVGCFGTFIFLSRWKVCCLSEKYYNLSENARKKARAKSFFFRTSQSRLPAPYSALYTCPESLCKGAKNSFFLRAEPWGAAASQCHGRQLSCPWNKPHTCERLITPLQGLGADLALLWAGISRSFRAEDCFPVALQGHS